MAMCIQVSEFDQNQGIVCLNKEPGQSVWTRNTDTVCLN